MAYVAPATPLPGDVLTAAFWDTHVRDRVLQTPEALVTAAGQQLWSTGANANTIVPVAKYKTADQTVNNSTTLVDDTHLAWAVAANEVWAFSGFLYWTIASGSPGVKWGFTVPTGGVGWYLLLDANTNVGTPVAPDAFPLAIASSQARALGAVTSHVASLQGFFQNGANAGTVQFQWAQQAAVASDVKLKLGSYIALTRLA